MKFVIVLILNLIRRLQILFVTSIQLRLQLLITESRQHALRAVEPYARKFLFTHALFTPAAYTIGARNVAIKVATCKHAATFAALVRILVVFHVHGFKLIHCAAYVAHRLYDMPCELSPTEG